MSDQPRDFDIGQWLTGLQLGQYAAVFTENNISPQTLAHLTGEDLKELGVTSLGHRKMLVLEIQKLIAGDMPASAMGPLTSPPRAEPRATKAKPANTSPAPQELALRKPATRISPAQPAISAVPLTTAEHSGSVSTLASGELPATEVSKSRRGFWMKLAASKFFAVSLVLHLFFGLGATYFIVQSIQTKRKLTFQGGPPSPNRSKRALEHKVSMAQKKKTGGAPPQAKRIVSTGLAKVSLPDMPAMPTAANVVPGMMSGMSGSGLGTGMGFGSGMGAGMGSGLGGGGPGINFFGLRTSAKRIAFLLDYSGSMSGAFRKTMERELEKALGKLPPGTQILLIPWAGPAWLHSQTAPDIMPKWKKVGAEFDNFVLVPGAKLETPKWISAGPANADDIMKGIRAQVAAPGGTDWRQPFRYVMEANPTPDVIIFMTDGQIPEQNADRALKAIDTALKKAVRPPTVNCLWIENSRYAGQDLKTIAAKYKGEFRAVTAKSGTND